jgi:putative hydrolase of the HAD superfamily
MHPVKNIIFDFGNVLFDLNLPLWESTLMALYGDQAAAAHQTLKKNNIFELYETGGIDTPEFISALRFVNNMSIEEKKVVAAWNSIFVEMPARRFDLLLRLRKQYSVFLLSNINDLHARWIEGYLLKEHQIYDFEQRYFDGVYYSHLIRLRKPSRDIYEYVLADAELAPESTVFFDDLEPNIIAARSCGIRAHLHPAGTDIGEHLQQLNLVPAP